MEEEVHVQVKDNSPSIERILRPITYTSWLLGVGVAHPRKCPKAITIITRIIHMAVCSINVIYDAIYFFSDIYQSNRLLFYIYCLNEVTCYLSAYYYIYHGIRQYNKWPELMDRLKELDQKIRKEISMNDRSIKIVVALAVFTTFTFCPLMSIISVLHDYYILSRSVHMVIANLLFYYVLAQSLINSFVFVVVVYVLYCRFQTLNKLIGQLDKLSDAQWIAFRIRRIRELHADICDLASMVNDIHGLHLLFCSLSCFTMAVFTLFNLYSLNQYYAIILIQYFSCLLFTMQFCLICWICTFASQESNRSGRIIHKIILNLQPVNLDKHEMSNQSSPEVRSHFDFESLEDSNDEKNSNCSSNHIPYVVENYLRRNLDQICVTKEINDFLTQLQQNPVAFTVYHFFEINNASFGCFIGVIFTYVIIFVQFNQQYDNNTFYQQYGNTTFDQQVDNITININ